MPLKKELSVETRAPTDTHQDTCTNNRQIPKFLNLGRRTVNYNITK